MSITAADITIPTTLDLNAAPQCLPSLEEARKHRAQQARHQTSACPHCGEWAIVETVTACRVGMPLREMRGGQRSLFETTTEEEPA